jgi:hypothetical protein
MGSLRSWLLSNLVPSVRRPCKADTRGNFAVYLKCNLHGSPLATV